MIAAWMLYCVGIGLAFVVMGHAIERALHWAGRQTRWSWTLALAGTLLVPAAAWLAPDGFRTVSIAGPQPVAHEPAEEIPSGVIDATVIAGAASQRAFTPRALDRPLAWGCALASAGLLGLLVVAAVRLARLRRRWRATVVDGRPILVSEDVGPAVTGLWRPRVVIPAWALELAERQRHLILTHEEEHLRAGDPWLLAFGAAALVLAPWNPALWWHVRRLRLAVEMDCDARVLAKGGPARDYGELLIAVGVRRGGLLLAAPALGEPQSFLERRIRRMATVLPRWRWAGAALALVVAAGATVGACEAPRPVEPERQIVGEAAGEAVSPQELATRLLRERIREMLARHSPDLLTERTGPPVDVWFAHDARLQVLHSVQTKRTHGRIGIDEIRSIFSDLDTASSDQLTVIPGRSAWGVVDGRSLEGLVRENVRVIWVHLEAGPSLPETPAANGRSQERALITEDAFAEGVVDERPKLLSGPQPEYPALLRQAGIHGRVVVQAIIDTLGRAEPRSVKVISSPHVGFNQSAIQVVTESLFRPARVHGRAVRVLMRIPVRFTLPSDGMRQSHGQAPAETEDVLRSSLNFRGLAHRYHPDVFTRPVPGAAIALVFDAQGRVIGHAAGVREARDGSCLEVVERLLPQFADRTWSSSGCAEVGAEGSVIVYWKALRRI